jgi:uncharacterized protein (TIGR00369 family)
MALIQLDTGALRAAMPFTEIAGLELVEAGPERVEGRLAWAPERCTSAGLMHGGALMTLADSMGGLCAFLNLPAGATTSTIESKTNFFRAVREGAAHAVSRPVHVGSSTIGVQTEIRDDAGRLVALTFQTQAVRS